MLQKSIKLFFFCVLNKDIYSRWVYVSVIGNVTVCVSVLKHVFYIWEFVVKKDFCFVYFFRSKFDSPKSRMFDDLQRILFEIRGQFILP